MSSNSAPTESTSSLSPVNCHSQVRLEQEGDKLLIILPPTQTPIDWSMWQELKFRLHNGDRFWSDGVDVQLVAKEQLLDGRQLQSLAGVLQEANLQLKWVCTSRRQTAVAAATAGYSVQQELPPTLTGIDEPQGIDEPKAERSEPLYLQSTVRSGVEVRHPGTVVIWGDLNPGGIVIAAGDIFVWGSLRGVAHAGALGDRRCRIMALCMKPTQLRIADVVARAPESPPQKVEPEVAYLSPAGIGLAKAINFAKTHSFSAAVKGWVAKQVTKG